MFTRSMRWTYVVTAWIILAAVFVQVFLAGLGVFVSGKYFEAHAIFGSLLGLVMIVELLFAFAARLPRRAIGLTALLPVLVILQIVFVEVGRSTSQIVAALHPVNALVIFGVAAIVATRAATYLSPRATPTVISTPSDPALVR